MNAYLSPKFDPMDQFWKVTGIIFWILTILIIILRLVFGKDWLLKSSSRAFFGTGLINSTNQLLTDFQNRNIQREHIAEFIAHVLWRLTRIGLFATLFALIPTTLLWQQNQLLSVQNERIDLQNNLIEAQRRGSLVILMSNVLDQMNQEINSQKEQRQAEGKADTLSYRLSEPLIGRIAGLSQGFLPYRIFQGDALTDREYSLERGQLLLTLVNSRLDSATMASVYFSTVFRQSYLPNAKLRGAFLRDADLRGAFLRGANLRDANLRDANLRGANLSGAFLRGVDFSDAILSGANLRDANLSGAFLSGAFLSGADFSDADLNGAILSGADFSDADLNGADLRGADLRGADLRGADLRGADLRGADLRGAIKITTNQLKLARSLYQVKNLDSVMQVELKNEKPCLFTPQGCE